MGYLVEARKAPLKPPPEAGTTLQKDRLRSGSGFGDATQPIWRPALGLSVLLIVVALGRFLSRRSRKPPILVVESRARPLEPVAP
jgi:hypothetical protein